MLVDVPTTDVNCPLEIEIPKDEYSCLVIDGQGSVAAFGKAAVAKTFGYYADRFVHQYRWFGRGLTALMSHLTSIRTLARQLKMVRGKAQKEVSPNSTTGRKERRPFAFQLE